MTSYRVTYEVVQTYTVVVDVDDSDGRYQRDGFLAVWNHPEENSGLQSNWLKVDEQVHVIEVQKQPDTDRCINCGHPPGQHRDYCEGTFRDARTLLPVVCGCSTFTPGR